MFKTAKFSSLNRSKPENFVCFKHPLSWYNFYSFAIASMAPKIAKKPPQTRLLNTKGNHSISKGFYLGIKSPVHETGKKLDWDQTGPEKTDHSMKKKTKPDLCSPCKYASFATTLKKNGQELLCYSQNDMLPSNPTCTTTCSYCFLRCRNLLSL